MKKTLIALAALAATAAFAQSSVSITGGMRIGYGQLASGAKGLMTTQGSGNTINVTVVEDLGGGLAAEGAVQYRYDMSNGGNNAGNAAPTTTAAANGRQFQTTRLGLKGGFGAIQMGRIGLDQHWGYTSFGSTSAGVAVMPVSDLGATESNQIRYITPGSLIPGFTAHLAQSFKGSAAVTNPTSTTFNEGTFDGQQVLLSYVTGPVSLMYVAEKLNNGRPGRQIGASYDLGVAKINVISGLLKTIDGTATTKNALTLSGTVPMGALTLKAAMKNDRTAFENNAVALGVDYALSKRTVVEVTTWKNETDAKSNLWAGVKHSF